MATGRAHDRGPERRTGSTAGVVSGACAARTVGAESEPRVTARATNPGPRVRGAAADSNAAKAAVDDERRARGAEAARGEAAGEAEGEAAGTDDTGGDQAGADEAAGDEDGTPVSPDKVVNAAGVMRGNAERRGASSTAAERATAHPSPATGDLAEWRSTSSAGAGSSLSGRKPTERATSDRGDPSCTGGDSTEAVRSTGAARRAARRVGEATERSAATVSGVSSAGRTDCRSLPDRGGAEGEESAGPSGVATGKATSRSGRATRVSASRKVRSGRRTVPRPS